MRKIHNKIYDTLLYLTNNLSTSRDEIKFDIGFFIVIMLATFISIPLLIRSGIESGSVGEFAWAAIVLIFAVESWDSMRHNRA
jgi:hypothetical protein